MSYFDVIDGIIESDFKKVSQALQKDPSCVNHAHKKSGMTAAMLAAQGCMPSFLRKILDYAEHIDFSYRDKYGRDLLEVSMDSGDPDLVEMVTDAYETHAKHIINNWPEP